MRTLYLLGAGASAAESNIGFGDKRIPYIPTVIRFPEAIDFLLTSNLFPYFTVATGNYITNWLNKDIQKDLKLLKNGTISFGTPDTYAKSILLSHGPKSDEYWNTKRAISFVIQAIQIFTSVDPRYFQFFSALLNYENPKQASLNENIFIATWNYDLQLNQSLTSLLGVLPNGVLESKINFHGKKNNQSGLKKIFRINGYAGGVLVGKDGEHHQDFGGEVDSFYNTTERDIDRLDGLIKFYNSANAQKNEFFINFAWDKNEASRREISDLIELAKTIECLVVVGYSFPIYNRETDMQILENMKNLEKVYVQDKIDHTYKIKEYLRAAHSYNDDGLALLVKYESNCDQFLVPNELYAESSF
ncbi:hypothetical protein [Leptospira bouyouniensis]|uniref:SIR2-like domain-containing protein n=1 Tax=Leptospira bouyouniensis TaxID=2484911 RepID=A0ABY2KZ39_9LEPT|nr:hypothetical protein [Leptospira bouyouniensis]TGK45527.1 hypothetical protein EHQ10_18950 [Leptospira bouyouniensis]